MKIVDGCIAEFEGDWTKMTCGGCCRFSYYNHVEPKGYRCCCGNVEGVITADHPACKDYWDKEEQAEVDQQRREEQDAERRRLWEENENRDSVAAAWTRDFDGSRDDYTNPYPICPDCENPLFSLADGGRCEYCGRKIHMTPELEEYYMPVPVEKKDCPTCGGKGTYQVIQSKYNGHRHGRCEKCGAAWME